MNNVRVLCLVSVLVLSLVPVSACALSDVGAVDYFRMSKTLGVKKSVDLSVPKPWEKPKANPERHLNYLVRKYADTGQPPILQGQSFSISLSSAFIGKFREIGKTGEIAIVARVSERKSGSLKFTSDAADSGRLIYFSNDVQEYQNLSFSYLPMYGPLQYNGRPLDVQLYVIEIDNVKQFKPLLSAVAKLGQKAYPPASEALGLLDSIGGALLSSSKNDNMFEYSFSLLPEAPNLEKESGFNPGEFPVLESGLYVLVRCQDRQVDQEALYAGLLVDKGDHKLARVSKDGKSIEAYKDDSYLVVHIKRESYALSMEEENSFHMVYADFKAREDELGAEYVERITEDLDSLKVKIAHKESIKKLHLLYQKVASAKAGQEELAKLDASVLLFELQDRIGAREACVEGSICPEIPTEREIMEVLMLMRGATAFSDVKDKLTYDVLKTPDPARDDAIVNSVAEKVKSIQ